MDVSTVNAVANGLSAGFSLFILVVLALIKYTYQRDQKVMAERFIKLDETIRLFQVEMNETKKEQDEIKTNYLDRFEKQAHIIAQTREDIIKEIYKHSEEMRTIVSHSYEKIERSNLSLYMPRADIMKEIREQIQSELNRLQK